MLTNLTGRHLLSIARPTVFLDMRAGSLKGLRYVSITSRAGLPGSSFGGPHLVALRSTKPVQMEVPGGSEGGAADTFGAPVAEAPPATVNERVGPFPRQLLGPSGRTVSWRGPKTHKIQIKIIIFESISVFYVWTIFRPNVVQK